LNQNINDLVGLIRQYDQNHIWLADNGETEGFIPYEALRLYENTSESNKTTHDFLAQNLIDLDEPASYSSCNMAKTSYVDSLKDLDFGNSLEENEVKVI
jgi:hypothetical protein